MICLCNMWQIQKTVDRGDYILAKVSQHPNAHGGFVLMHRIVMENHIGRLLKTDEVVHHIDGNKKNNDINNLRLMTNKQHASLHGRKIGRKAAKLKCPYCEKIFQRYYNQIFIQKGTQYTCCSAECRGKFSRNIQINGLLEEYQTRINENLIEVFYKTLE